MENLLTATVIRHQVEVGCTLATSFGIELAHPLRSHLAPGSQVQVSASPGDIALSRHYLTGISIQNQIKGRVCAIVPTGGAMLVQVDCGTTLLARITPRACRDMMLREGDDDYCLAKTQSFNYLYHAGSGESSARLVEDESFAGKVCREILPALECALGPEHVKH